MGFSQVHILLQFFLLHSIEMFVFSLNFLNSLMKFVIVLLNSVSRVYLHKPHLANISIGLLDFIGEILLFSFTLLVFLQ